MSGSTATKKYRDVSYSTGQKVCGKTTFVDVEIWRAFRVCALSTGVPVADLFNMALAGYLDRMIKAGKLTPLPACTDAIHVWLSMAENKGVRDTL